MNGTKVLALAAAGAFLVVAAPVGSAVAASLINPGAAAAVQQNAKDAVTTEVRWHWHHHHHWHHRWHHHRWHHRWHRHHWRHHRHW
jgi:hypothetical protein